MVRSLKVSPVNDVSTQGDTLSDLSINAAVKQQLTGDRCDPCRCAACRAFEEALRQHEISKRRLRRVAAVMDRHHGLLKSGYGSRIPERNAIPYAPRQASAHVCKSGGFENER